MLFDLYEEKAAGAQMSFQNGDLATTLPLTAFADDTNLLGNDDRQILSVHQLVNQTQRAFQLWDKLLHTTGHLMELGKCACYLSVWDFQEDGYAFTIPPDTLNIEITVKDVNGDTQLIRQLPSKASQKLLGVMRNPIGNQQDEVSRLQKKSNQMAMSMNSKSLTHTDAILAYEAFYLPAMRYSLAITLINQLDFEKIQGQATSAFLTSMGFNRNMPRQVVYAPKIYQGLGLRHLYNLQGCDSIRLLLQEINSKDSTTSSMLHAVLETIQLESGIGKPILKDTRPLDYLEWGWIPQIRDFLEHIDGKIMGATKTPPTYRQNDQYIMDSDILQTTTYKERMLIHRCRIFLQVKVLSDISDAMGERILSEWTWKNHRTQQRDGPSKKTQGSKHGRFGRNSSNVLIPTQMENCRMHLAIGREQMSRGVTTITATRRTHYYSPAVQMVAGERIPVGAQAGDACSSRRNLR
jgi:hypothetical protein